MSDPTAAFCYVDTAFGGVDRRNNVRRIDQVRLDGQADCYASYQRATEDLLTWVRTHTNKHGNPTVAGFDGPTWTPFLPLDFDHEQDPAVALGWLRRVLVTLDGWGVNLRAVRIFFSGGKGFHAELPHTLFGGFDPSADLHRRLKRAAELLLGDIPFDSSIYDRLRLWRLEGSRHGATGLYKLQLTAHEALTLDYAAIRALARHPRPPESEPALTPIPDDEWAPNPALAGLWAEAAAGVAVPRERQRGAVTDDARDRQTVAAIAASWPHDKAADLPPGDQAAAGSVSRHTDYLLPIAGFLAGRTSDDAHVAELLQRAAAEAGDAAFLRGRDWRAEIERIAASSADKRAEGQPVTGLPTLGERFPALAAVLDALWPAPEVIFADDGTATPARAAGDADALWPEPLADEAYHGLLGELVRAIEPHSEADPAAILAHGIVGAGVFVGRHVQAVAGDAPHPPRFDAVVVGRSSIGRKGSAQRATERALGLADPTFTARNITEGLSSGEGLIWQVRDPIYRMEKVGKGADARYEEVLVDAGVDDKRLWVVETEFASPLRVAQREGNTLTAVVRRAWDRDDLKTLTKNSPARATGAHIGILGHISRDELLRYLDRSELANGFANRFLFFAARRARVLPDGECVPEDALAPLGARLRVIGAWAETPRVLRRDGEARAIWHAVYEQLSEGRPGMFGGAVNRAAAQVLRLSVLYAVLDCAEAIRAEHLLAALAVWRYCEQSARWVFGDAIGDPDADTILSALRRGGPLDREDIVNLFGRHVRRDRIDRALGTLLAAGLARMEKVATGGRPREVWRAA